MVDYNRNLVAFIHIQNTKKNIEKLVLLFIIYSNILRFIIDRHLTSIISQPRSMVLKINYDKTYFLKVKNEDKTVLH